MSPSLPTHHPVDPLVRRARLNGLMAAQGASTEQVNPETLFLDCGSTLETLTLLNQQDQTVAKAVEQALPQLASLVDAVVCGLEQGGRLVYVGAGTSGRLGVLDAVECVPTFGTEPDQVQGVLAGGYQALTQAVEGAEDDAAQGENDMKVLLVDSKDVVVGISASGGAAYVRAALQYAGRQGALTGCVVNHLNAPLINDVKYPVVVQTGPESIAGSTRMKAGTAQKLVLNMLSTATMVRMGRTYGNVMIDVKPTNAKLVQRSRRLVMGLTGLDETTAIQLLETTKGQVKEAVLMGTRQVSYQQAQAMLKKTQGFVGPWLDSESSPLHQQEGEHS